AFLCADRVALMRGGKLMGLGAPDSVLTEEALRGLYGVEVRITTVDGGAAGPRRVCVPSVTGRRH
ncbi:MAG: hypothetical protein ACRET6_08375, partial [Burkholderiales bacterium]